VEEEGALLGDFFRMPRQSKTVVAELEGIRTNGSAGLGDSTEFMACLRQMRVNQARLFKGDPSRKP